MNINKRFFFLISIFLMLLTRNGIASSLELHRSSNRSISFHGSRLQFTLAGLGRIFKKPQIVPPKGDEFCFIAPRMRADITTNQNPVFVWSGVPKAIAILDISGEQEPIYIEDKTIMARGYWIPDTNLSVGEYYFRALLEDDIEGSNGMLSEPKYFEVRSSSDNNGIVVPTTQGELEQLIAATEETSQNYYWDLYTATILYYEQYQENPNWLAEFDEVRSTSCPSE